MTTSIKFLLFMWISESFLFTEVFWPFLSRFFRIFTNHHILFFFYLLRCTVFTTYNFLLSYFYEKLLCFLWLCGVESSLSGFLISLIFRHAIIVDINVDLCVWFCKNLMWNIFCLFFLRVNKWIVWHSSNCF